MFTRMLPTAVWNVSQALQPKRYITKLCVNTANNISETTFPWLR
jgi:hypothetical protein